MIEHRRLGLEDRPRYLPSILGLVDRERRRADSLINPGPPSFYQQFFTPAGAVWGALEGETLRGFALLGLSPLVPALWMPYIAALGADRRDCGIQFSLLVGEPYRRMGVGSALYRCRISHARERGVEHLFSLVHPDNAGSLRLLSKHAFSVLDRLDAYEQAGPRLVMHKPLASAAQDRLLDWPRCPSPSTIRSSRRC